MLARYEVFVDYSGSVASRPSEDGLYTNADEAEKIIDELMAQRDEARALVIGACKFSNVEDESKYINDVLVPAKKQWVAGGTHLLKDVQIRDLGGLVLELQRECCRFRALVERGENLVCTSQVDQYKKECREALK